MNIVWDSSLFQRGLSGLIGVLTQPCESENQKLKYQKKKGLNFNFKTLIF